MQYVAKFASKAGRAAIVVLAEAILAARDRAAPVMAEPVRLILHRLFSGSFRIRLLEKASIILTNSPESKPRCPKVFRHYRTAFEFAKLRLSCHNRASNV